MKVPFTTEQFLSVFERYNLAMFPAQIVIMLLALSGLFLLHTKRPIKDKFIEVFLGSYDDFGGCNR